MTDLCKKIKNDLQNFPDEVIESWLEPFAQQYGWPLPDPIRAVVFGDLNGSEISLIWDKQPIMINLLNLPLTDLETKKMSVLYKTLLNFEESDGGNLEECKRNHFDPGKFKRVYEYCKASATTLDTLFLYERKSGKSTAYNVIDGNHRFIAYKYWVEKMGNNITKQQSVWIAKS